MLSPYGPRSVFASTGPSLLSSLRRKYFFTQPAPEQAIVPRVFVALEHPYA